MVTTNLSMIYISSLAGNPFKVSLGWNLIWPGIVATVLDALMPFLAPLIGLRRRELDTHQVVLHEPRRVRAMRSNPEVSQNMFMTQARNETEHGATSNVCQYPFHRLAHASARYRWWKPLLVGVVATVLYALMIVVALLALAVASLLVPEVGTAMAAFSRGPQIDLTDPFIFTLTLFSVILMLPSLLIATRIFNVQPVGFLSSVTGRIRWRWLGRCLGLGGAVYAIGYLAIFVLAAVRGEPATPQFDNPQLPILLVLTLLLVPIQAATEEYVFRGYLMQTIGGWLRHPACAILLPVPLFVLGHDYELVGMIDIAVFAIAAGWLTWRTGGLEAAIGLHILNNCAIFALGTVGMVDPNATNLGLTDLAFSFMITLAAVTVVLAAAKRDNIARVSELAGSGQVPELR